MLKVRDIMTTDVATLSPESTVREAMELLGRRHVSGAPVVSGGTLLGLVSANDLMTFAAALSGVPTEREIHDEWGEVAEPSIEEEVEREAEAAGAGFAEMWDDAGAEVSGRMDYVNSPEWNVLEEHVVSEVMTAMPLRTIAPDAPVSTAAEWMRRDAIHRLLVTEGDKLVGIVSTLDVTKAVADHQLTSRVYVFNRDSEFGAAE